MTDQDIHAEAAAEVKRRVAAGRAEGLYPDDLEAQLTSQFVRSGKDPLLFQHLDAARATVDRLRGFTFDRTQIQVDSELPGGRVLHRLVAKIVGRQVDGVLTQLSAYSDEVAQGLTATVDALDELRTAINNDLFGDIDAVHHRLVALEHRLVRIESAASGPAPDDSLPG